MYEPRVYQIFNEMFVPDREPCMEFLKALTKQKGFNVNYPKIVRETRSDPEDVQRWVHCLVVMGLIENTPRHGVNKLGMGRFENQARPQRRINANFTKRTLYLIDQQLHRPPLDRIYFNSDKNFRDRVDRVTKYVKKIRVRQLYVSGLALFASKNYRTREELLPHFKAMPTELQHVLDAMQVQGLIKATDDNNYVARHGRLQKEINLITEASSMNNRRLLPTTLRDIIAQQVFRGYANVQKNQRKYKKVQIIH